MSTMMRPTCFLIDDDQDDQELFQSAMHEVSNAFTTVGTQDPLEAISVLSEGSLIPEHIFLDINMPVMSGNECLLELRKLVHLKDVPIYIYTTSANVTERQRYLLNGAQQVLIKPCSMEEIVRMLQTLLYNVNVR